MIKCKTEQELQQYLDKFQEIFANNEVLGPLLNEDEKLKVASQSALDYFGSYGKQKGDKAACAGIIHRKLKDSLAALRKINALSGDSEKTFKEKKRILNNAFDTFCESVSSGEITEFLKNFGQTQYTKDTVKFADAISHVCTEMSDIAADMEFKERETSLIKEIDILVNQSEALESEKNDLEAKMEAMHVNAANVDKKYVAVGKEIRSVKKLIEQEPPKPKKDVKQRPKTKKEIELQKEIENRKNEAMKLGEEAFKYDKQLMDISKEIDAEKAELKGYEYTIEKSQTMAKKELPNAKLVIDFLEEKNQRQLEKIDELKMTLKINEDKINKGKNAEKAWKELKKKEEIVNAYDDLQNRLNGIKEALNTWDTLHKKGVHIGKLYEKCQRKEPMSADENAAIDSYQNARELLTTNLYMDPTEKNSFSVLMDQLESQGDKINILDFEGNQTALMMIKIPALEAIKKYSVAMGITSEQEKKDVALYKETEAILKEAERIKKDASGIKQQIKDCETEIAKNNKNLKTIKDKISSRVNKMKKLCGIKDDHVCTLEEIEGIAKNKLQQAREKQLQAETDPSLEDLQKQLATETRNADEEFLMKQISPNKKKLLQLEKDAIKLGEIREKRDFVQKKESDLQGALKSVQERVTPEGTTMRKMRQELDQDFLSSLDYVPDKEKSSLEAIKKNNSPEYNAYREALQNAIDAMYEHRSKDELKGKLTILKDKAKAYTDEKAKQWRPWPFASEKRYFRIRQATNITRSCEKWIKRMDEMFLWNKNVEAIGQCEKGLSEEFRTQWKDYKAKEKEKPTKTNDLQKAESKQTENEKKKSDVNSTKEKKQKAIGLGGKS